MSDHPHAHEYYVQLILAVLGFPESFVTNESRVSDFMCTVEPIDLDVVGAVLGVEIARSDLVYQVAEQMRARRNIQ